MNWTDSYPAYSNMSLFIISKPSAPKILQFHKICSGKDMPYPMAGPLEEDFKIHQPTNHHLAFLNAKLSRPFTTAEHTMNE